MTETSLTESVFPGSVLSKQSPTLRSLALILLPEDEAVGVGVFVLGLEEALGTGAVLPLLAEVEATGI